MQDTILIFSRSQDEAALVAKTMRCRETYCLPLPFETPAQDALGDNVRGIIVMSDAYGEEALAGLDPALLDGQVPVLALGGAAAAVCRQLGGECAPALCERSAVTLSLQNDPLFEDISGGERMLSALSTLTLPPCALPIATATEQVIGFRHESLPIYGMQYPIERNDPDAAQMLANFAQLICQTPPTWTEEVIISRAVEHIRNLAPEGRVLCAVSGGVDSAVCAKLTQMAVGDRLLCVFIDTGLFREQEPEEVLATYESLGIHVETVDAHDSFLRALSGVTLPRDKERIASQLMTQVLIKQFSHDLSICAVVMGTNFNDTLLGEGHRNDVAAAGRSIGMCEPIRELFKDEVRRLASALELPSMITSRQPFPSSGLALRVMSSVTEERLRLLRAADACFREEITQNGHDRKLWQYYATLVENPDAPDGYAVCLRATNAAQGGAMPARLPYDLLERTAQRIREEVPGVLRIVYDLTPSVHYGELE